MRAIGPELGLARNAVRRLAHAASADELLVGRWTGRASILDPHKPYLHQRWTEGCTVARRQFEKVRERGYSGGESVVKKYVHRLREAFPLDPPRKTPSVRDVTGWLTRHPDRLTDDQAQRLKEIPARCPELDRERGHAAVKLSRQYPNAREQGVADPPLCGRATGETTPRTVPSAPSACGRRRTVAGLNPLREPPARR